VTVALRAAGVDAKHVGDTEARLNIQIGKEQGFSVKGHFSNSGKIRLINTIGNSDP